MKKVLFGSLVLTILFNYNLISVDYVSYKINNHKPATKINQINYTFCPTNMVYIYGQMLVGDSEYIEALQNNACTKWISKTFPERCAIFSETRWKKIKDKIPKKQMEFCIDTWEYPNQFGLKPEVNMTWEQAKDICFSLGKRLCTEEEWSFACEGEEGWPYPYGYIRNNKLCNIDKKWIAPDYISLFGSNSELELNKLWQGNNIGENASCISPFGVFDLTGNVDEFTISSKKTGYISILKGGYWSKVRARCRPSTRAHNQWHRNYQLGFRCCSDIKEVDYSF